MLLSAGIPRELGQQCARQHRHVHPATHGWPTNGGTGAKGPGVLQGKSHGLFRGL